MTQEKALEYLASGRNVFLTGPAGSGKTTVLNRFIAVAQNKGKKIAVTASTGIAATHLSGTTIHSWAGIGINDNLSQMEIDRLKQKEFLYKRFRETDILIIDEVSMLHSFRLDLVERVLRNVSKEEDLFGGIQIVLAGDFFQLPPVNRSTQQTHYAFESRAWAEMDLAICYLDTIYRQSDDPLLDVLQEIRTGELSEESQELLLERMESQPPDTITPTRLYTHNVDVDTMNAEELKRLKGRAERFMMSSTGKAAHVKVLKKYCLAPEYLQLKVGAQVMFLKNNFSEGYANGTLGTVTGFDLGRPVVETVEGKEVIVSPDSWAMDQGGVQMAQISQIPLRLAWAITVHKSQGMTLDQVEVDLSKSFASGMGYVALSRVQSLQGLHIKGINRNALAIDPNVKEQDEWFQKVSASLE